MRKLKVLNMKMGKVRVIGNCKYSLTTCFVCYVYENNCKTLFSIRFVFWGRLRFGQINFLLQDIFFFGRGGVVLG